MVIPAFEADSLTDDQVQEVLQRSMSIVEWEDLFSKINVGIFPTWLLDDDDKENLVWDTSKQRQPLSIGRHLEDQVRSPISSKDRAGLVLTVPMLSFEEGEDMFKEDDVGPVTLDVFSSSMKLIHSRFGSLKDKWAKAFQEVESNYIIMAKDLSTLDDTVRDMTNSVGSPSSLGGVAPHSVWAGLLHVYNTAQNSHAELMQLVQSTRAKMNGVVVELQHVSNTLGSQPTALDYDAVDDRLGSVENKVIDHDRRFSQVLQFCRRVQQGHLPQTRQVGHSQLEVEDLKKQISDLQHEVIALKDVASPTQASRSLDEQLRDISGQVKLLQQRIMGNEVQIGSKVFQSFDDVKVWIRSQLPSRRFGLFVDAVSLLDFISAVNHSDSEKTFTAFHNQQKTGFTSMYEARIAISTQHLFPTIFG